MKILSKPELRHKLGLKKLSYKNISNLFNIIYKILSHIKTNKNNIQKIIKNTKSLQLQFIKL